jgi:hypothetical protein
MLFDYFYSIALKSNYKASAFRTLANRVTKLLKGYNNFFQPMAKFKTIWLAFIQTQRNRFKCYYQVLVPAEFGGLVPWALVAGTGTSLLGSSTTCHNQYEQ